MSPPLKRHPALQPLSREHHEILLLGFKLRQGFKNNTNPERMLSYCRWFFDSFLGPHLKKEESCLSHCFGKTSKLIHSLKQNHKALEKAFTKLDPSYSSLRAFEQVVVDHVRYEERELFAKIQNSLTEEDLKHLSTHLNELKFQEQLSDVFWHK